MQRPLCSKVLQQLQDLCPQMCHAIKSGTHIDGRFFFVMHVSEKDHLVLGDSGPPPPKASVAYLLH